MKFCWLITWWSKAFKRGQLQVMQARSSGGKGRGAPKASVKRSSAFKAISNTKYGIVRKALRKNQKKKSTGVKRTSRVAGLTEISSNAGDADEQDESSSWITETRTRTRRSLFGPVRQWRMTWITETRTRTRRNLLGRYAKAPTPNVTRDASTRRAFV